MSRKPTTIFFVLIIAAFIALTVKSAPVKIIHPDALRFMAIFQQQYDAITSFSDVPRAVFRGISRANAYDDYRGRLTTYVAFGVEALMRSHMPFPFISWLTMVVLIFNATLLSRLVTRDLASPSVRLLLFFLAILILLMNALFIASYEMQFIYAKYLCVTFMLLFMLLDRSAYKGAALIGAIFSDEIGVAFAMVAIFLIVFNNKYRVENIKNVTPASILKPVVLSAAAAFTILLLYFGTLKLFFHHISDLIQNGGFSFHVPMEVIIKNSINYLSILARVSGGAVGITILLLLFAFRWIGKLRQFRYSHVFQQEWTMPLSLTNKQFQEIIVAIFLALFIEFKMYRGTTSIFYYGYPISMLIMFVVLSLLIEVASARFAVGAFMVMGFSLALHVQNGFDFMEKVVHKEWLADKTVQLKDFDLIEAAINETIHSNCSLAFSALNNDQDIFAVSDTYGEKYFPTLGIVKILAWPHKC
jgi:hypothetical protein